MYSGGGGALVKREVQDQWLRGSGSGAHVLVATPVLLFIRMRWRVGDNQYFNSLLCLLRCNLLQFGQGRLLAHCASGAVNTGAVRM